MIRLVLLVAAIAIFGTGFITVIINQLTSAKKIIMDLYNSEILGYFRCLVKWQFYFLIH